MENRIQKPVTTTKFVEMDLPKEEPIEDELPPEEEIEPTKTEDDLSEEPTIGE